MTGRVNRVTFSKVALLLGCGAWLREGAVWTEHSMYEKEGNAIDAPFSAFVQSGGKVDAFAHAADPKLAQIWQATKEWLVANYRVGMRAQVVFAYDVEKDIGWEVVPLPDAPARFYADPEWREKHGIQPHEVCGAADLVFMGRDEQGDFVAVDDLKVKLGAEVKDATHQLGGLALAACRAYGLDRARIRTLIADERRVFEATVWLDEFDHLDAREDMARALARVDESEPTPGPWCTERYCPHIADCSAKQQDVTAAEQLVPVDALVKRRVDMPLTLTIASPDHAADVLARARAVERVAKMLKSAVGGYVDEYMATHIDGNGKPQGVPLSDGSTLQPTFRNMPRVNHAKIEQLAKDYGATDEDIASCVNVVREGAGLKVVAAAKAKRGRAA